MAGSLRSEGAEDPCSLAASAELESSLLELRWRQRGIRTSALEFDGVLFEVAARWWISGEERAVEEVGVAESYQLQTGLSDNSRRDVCEGILP